jgi:3-(3-hydroxy-phenyl)propionate hydroxylase
MGNTATRPVVGIVGAGPVGLACALRLASFGISVVLLDENATLVKQGSKACLIQGDVLEILDKIGCADQVANEGVQWSVGHTYVRGLETVRTVYPRGIGFGPFINISQHRIQEIMLARLEAASMVAVRWSHRVEQVEQDDDGVTVSVDAPEGKEKMRFAYLLACDGVRSGIRDMLGVKWTGYTHKDRFLITDIRADLALPRERHFHYDPPFNPGRQLVIHPQPDNIWRIDWQLAPDADINEEKRNGKLDQRIRAVIGDIEYSIDWLSVYRFHQRVVDRFKVGRVLFAGDAAHALPPYGSRGMNSGIQDADNLAWKLALVVRGEAREALLETYHEERYAAAKENLRVTEATIRFMVPPNLAKRMYRSVILRLSSRVRFLRKRINSGRMAEPYVYRDSSIMDYAARSPLVGSFAADARVYHAGKEERLRRRLGYEFTFLYVGGTTPAHMSVLEDPARFDGVEGVRFIALMPESVVLNSHKAVTLLRYRDDTPPLPYDPSVPRWYAIRTDGHIAGIYDPSKRIDFAAVAARCSGGARLGRSSGIRSATTAGAGAPLSEQRTTP